MRVIEVSWSTPTLTLPHHRRGRVILGRVQSTVLKTPRLQGGGSLVCSLSEKVFKNPQKTQLIGVDSVAELLRLAEKVGIKPADQG